MKLSIQRVHTGKTQRMLKPLGPPCRPSNRQQLITHPLLILEYYTSFSHREGLNRLTLHSVNFDLRLAPCFLSPMQPAGSSGQPAHRTTPKATLQQPPDWECLQDTKVTAGTVETMWPVPWLRSCDHTTDLCLVRWSLYSGFVHISVMFCTLKELYPLLPASVVYCSI